MIGAVQVSFTDLCQWLRTRSRQLQLERRGTMADNSLMIWDANVVKVDGRPFVKIEAAGHPTELIGPFPTTAKAQAAIDDMRMKLELMGGLVVPTSKH